MIAWTHWFQRDYHLHSFSQARAQTNSALCQILLNGGCFGYCCRGRGSGTVRCADSRAHSALLVAFWYSLAFHPTIRHATPTYRCLCAACVCIIKRCLASMHFLFNSSRFREVKITIRSKYFGVEHNGLRDKSSSRSWGKARTNSITESTSSTWFFCKYNTFNWVNTWSGATSAIWQLAALKKCNWGYSTPHERKVIK